MLLALPHTKCAFSLTSQELDDDVDIDWQAEIASARQADHGGPERLGVERDPVGRVLAAGIRRCALIEIENFLLGTNRDHVTRTKLIAGAGDFDAVHEEVAVNDALTGLGAGLGEAGAANHIVETPF